MKKSDFVFTTCVFSVLKAPAVRTSKSNNGLDVKTPTLCVDVFRVKILLNVKVEGAE